MLCDPPRHRAAHGQGKVWGQGLLWASGPPSRAGAGVRQVGVTVISQGHLWSGWGSGTMQKDRAPFPPLGVPVTSGGLLTS